MGIAAGLNRFRKRFMARTIRRDEERMAEMFRERKQALLGPVRGRILEIGPGTGANLAFLHPSVTWIGLEPNREMHPHLLAKAKGLGLAVDLRAAPCEATGLPGASVDHVLSTHVLCSVRDPDRVLSEVRRVLRPGGSFLFLEHVIDPRRNLRRAVQRLLPYTPYFWCSDGCNPDRDLAATIRAADFASVECTAFMPEGPGLFFGVNRPHIVGCARNA